MKIVFNHPSARRELPPRRSSGERAAAAADGAQADAVSGNFFRMKSRSHQQGIALVITLIMLSVTLVMALAFLAISTRERGSVSTSTDATHAREATEAALANAEAQVLASILATTNSYNFGLFVSTNYLHADGFVTTAGPGTGVSGATNVNYYYTNGAFLNAADMQQNIANLLYLPRAPVFVPTNSAGSNEFRYYLDLNRNGMFDANNNVSNWVYSGGTVTYISNNITEIGDPEWIGVLEHPDQPHGPLNRFIGRYAFIAVPVGNTLDINAMYNDSMRPDNVMAPGRDGFLRNEGVGSWEINLAAFLADLNTNEWDNNTFGNGYRYLTPYGSANNSGAAFEDALGLLRYRYGYNVFNQTNVTQYANYKAFSLNNIDDYSDGPLMTNNNLAFDNDSFNVVPPLKPWAGSDNTNHFFTPSDFFNQAIFRPAGYNILPNSQVFADRLFQAGTNTLVNGNINVPTYDRYTFYRMLAQLGTDSTPDAGKMNVNYVNLDNNGSVVVGMETNLIPWTNALAFFTNAADHMLRTYTTNWYNTSFFNFTNTFGVNARPFGVTNIPVWADGRFVYTPSVQRLLQVAANIYDATTNTFYPHVFRPRFSRDTSNNVTINAYDNIVSVVGTSDLVFSKPFDASDFSLNGGVNVPVNIYGVPWVIGAKKGLPNFNEFSMETVAQITRKMEVVKDPVTKNLSATNVAWVFGISNAVGVECWNSYSTPYPFTNNFSIAVADYLWVTLETTNGFILTTNYSFLPAAPLPSPLPNFTWSGSSWTGAARDALDTRYPTSFVIPMITNAVVLPGSYYQFSPQAMVPQSNSLSGFQPLAVAATLPQMALQVSNRLQFIMLDGTNVIDYVQLGGPDISTNINPIFEGTSTTVNYPNWWSTAPAVTGLFKSLPAGIASQLYVSIVPYGGNGSYWGNANDQTFAQKMMDGFAEFLGLGPPYPAWINDPTVRQIATNTIAQVPYTPTVTIYNYTSYQVNDPLVHYLTNDLSFSGTENGLLTGLHTWPLALGTPVVNALPILPDMGVLNQRYAPWGVRGQVPASADVNSNNLAYKDPLVVGSDSWDFPTNVFPGVGWLGRVHRGTPWQTVYLKSTNILSLFNFSEGGVNAYGLQTWAYWTGNNNAFDATNTAPPADRLLFDVFTTAPNENATLGQLSINQTHLAAWSALLSGIPVYTNLLGTNMTLIDPAGPYGTNYSLGTNNLGFIWNSIQQTRMDTNQYPKQVFGHVGDILSVPGFSDASPFLQGNDPRTAISDQMYEWLPQQIMSMVKVGTPRYVIYCYGQALKPAPNGLITSGVNALMCTNYQIVSESATRAVVQVENANSATPHVVLKNLNPLPPDQ